MSTSSTLSGKRQRGQPHPVVDPGCGDPARQRAGIGDERLDGVGVREAAERPPEGRERQHPRDRMLGRRVVSRTADQGESHVDGEVDERRVGTRVQVERESGGESGGCESEYRPAQAYALLPEMGRRGRAPAATEALAPVCRSCVTTRA